MAKVVYIYYWKNGVVDGKQVKPVACTNKRLLAQYSGLGYENIVRIFTRQHKVFWEDDEHFIVKIMENSIIRGAQKLSRVGRGGKRFGSGGY